ncbi:MAG: GDSL-type esterase/lipase family protein [Acutalibacteraceae bacterium]|nr:GDSL-type esterase/lipase family protein [Acutalibacteraceae bacterium]
MRSVRKILALLLTALMAVLCIVPTFAAPARYNTYSVIGDSIAAGYMLPGYKFGGKKKAAWHLQEQSYPWHIARAVGAKRTYQMAHGGYRTSDVRLILDDSYQGDFINGRRLPSIGKTRDVDWDAMNKLRREFRSNIAKSDLITVNLGSNDATQAFSVLMELVEDDVSIMQAQAQMGLDPLENLGYTLANVIELTTNSVIAARLVKLEADAFTGFSQNFDTIIREIRKLNSHAKIVVMGIYNPVEVASIDTMLTNVQYGQILTPVFDLFNNYMQYQSPMTKEYTYVDMVDIETYVGIGQLDANPDVLMDAHPTARGHRQMADEVLAVL